MKPAAEHNAVEIERLALVPAGRRPQSDDRVDNGQRIICRKNAQPEPPIVRDAQQMVDDGKARPAPRAVPIPAVVDAANISELLEFQAGRIAQRCTCGKQLSRFQHSRDLAQSGINAHQLVAKRCLEHGGQGLGA